MPDIVRAKLHKITGYVLRDAKQLPEALAHLQRAIQLESTIGVKKDIEQLARQLRPKPEPAPKTKTTQPRAGSPPPPPRPPLPLTRRHGAGVHQRRQKPQVNRALPEPGGTPINAGIPYPDCERRPPPTYYPRLS